MAENTSGNAAQAVVATFTLIHTYWITACCAVSSSSKKGHYWPREPDALFVDSDMGLTRAVSFMVDFYRKNQAISANLTLKLVNKTIKLPLDMFSCLPFDSIYVSALGADDHCLKISLADLTFSSSIRHAYFISDAKIDSVPPEAFKPPNLKTVDLGMNVDPAEGVVLECGPFHQVVAMDSQGKMKAMFKRRRQPLPLAAGDLKGELKIPEREAKGSMMSVGETYMDQLRALRRLQQVLAGGLASNDQAWTRFLTKGLYDPRLLLFVASFINGREYKL